MTCVQSGDSTPLKRAIAEAQDGLTKAQRSSLLAQMAVSAAAVVAAHVPSGERDALLSSIGGRD